MIEAIFIAAALFAGIVTMIVLIIRGLINVVPYARARSRLKDAVYGMICPYCSHMLDMLDRRTIEAYDRGRCPSCDHALVRMP